MAQREPQTRPPYVRGGWCLCGHSGAGSPRFPSPDKPCFQRLSVGEAAGGTAHLHPASACHRGEHVTCGPPNPERAGRSPAGRAGLRHSLEAELPAAMPRGSAHGRTPGAAPGAIPEEYFNQNHAQRSASSRGKLGLDAQCPEGCLAGG